MIPFLLMFSAATSAQERNPSDQLTIERIDALIASAESEPISSDKRAEVIEFYRKARAELRRAALLREMAASDKAAIETAPDEARRLTEQLRDFDPQGDPLPNEGTVAELQQLLGARSTKLSELRTQLTRTTQRMSARLERRRELTALQTSLPKRKSAIELELAKPVDEDPVPPTASARRVHLQAQLLAIGAELPSVQAELSRYDTEQAVELPELRAELLRKQIAVLEGQVQELTRRANAERIKQADEEKRILKSAAEQYSGELKRRADVTAELADENKELADKIAEATALLEQRTRTSDQLVFDESQSRSRVEQVGLIETVGLDLLNQMRELPSGRTIQQGFEPRKREMAEIQLRRADLKRQIALVEKELAGSGTPDPEDRAAVQSREVSRNRVDTLKTLGSSYAAYFNKLLELETSERELVKTIRRYRRFLNEHVLWLRSHRPLNLTDFGGVAADAQWLVSLGNLRGLVTELFTDFFEHVPLYIAVIVLIAVIAGAQGHWRRELVTIGREADRATFFYFRPTLRAALLTVLISMVGPAVCGFMGYRLSGSGDAFAAAAGQGLLAVSAAWLLLGLQRQSCRHHGLGEAHFDWSDTAVASLRRELRLLMLLILPLLFVATTMRRSGYAGASLERGCVILVLLIVAGFAWRILHPKRGVFAEVLANNPDGWARKTLWFWYPLSFGLPLLLALLAGFGYLLTTYELGWRLAGMIALAFVLSLLQALLFRWFVVSKRRMRIEQARLRRQAMLSAAPDPEGVPIVPEDDDSDLVLIGNQTERLINTGLIIFGLVATWLLWASVLPALSFLDRTELWHVQRTVTTSVKGENGEETRTETTREPVTLMDLLAFAMVALLTVTAARNLPGLLQIVLLQRLPLEPSLRYAIRTVARYVIVITGLVIGFSALGVSWSSVQWLAAALTVGLGFGLQEIFANFVSGLIILFERPVRIGDIVTIAEVTGTVTRLQIRATTITDWDRKEYIVPNKELVTGRLKNWTLSDSVNRIVIDVGVAYGSDTVRARALLLEVAGGHPAILNDPPPVATFEAFGDSALLLRMRCYLPGFDNRLQTITELHDAIHMSFEEEGIVIAFPQLDLHLQSTSGEPPGPVVEPESR